MGLRARVLVVDLAERDAVLRACTARGLWARALTGPDATCAIAIEPHSAEVKSGDLAALPGVRAVYESESGHPLVDGLGPTVPLGGLTIGRDVVLAAGPCAVESEDAIHRIARAVAASGARILRGGAYKPRTSPYTFRGHGEVALAWLTDAARDVGLQVCTEVLDPRDVEAVARAADLVQIGARSMQNGPLLRAVGAARLPVLLKRAPDATVDEWLLAGEALLASGAPHVIFCERGGRSPHDGVRNALDVSALALVAARGLPVAVDPSHAAGRRDLVPALARAGVAAGARLVLVEVHDAPDAARSDGPQALSLTELGALTATLGISRVQPES